MTLGGSSFLQVVPCGGQRFGGDCSGGLGLGGIADPPLSSLQKGSKKQLSKILKTGNKKKLTPRGSIICAKRFSWPVCKAAHPAERFSSWLHNVASTLAWRSAAGHLRLHF
jgi:hypothetical protein